MFTLLSSRRLLISAISLLIAVMIYRLLSSESSSTSRVLLARKILAQIPSGALIENEDISKSILPTRPPSEAHIGLPRHFYHDHNFASLAPPDLAHLSSLLTCNASPNPHTNHIRLPNLIFNVSSTPPDGESDGTQKFNPTIIALPHWSPNHYLLVSRVVTEGLHQESLLCEANICHLPNSSTTSLDSTPCTTSDTSVLGFAGGLRCVTKPETINIPPTPAERCTGAWSAFPDIPGFHDPRILWSGKGEPLIVVNSASRYGCVGLWIVDLRTLHKPLQQMLEARGGKGKGKEPLMSYPHLTELMRLERSEVEKNWMLFFPGREEAFVHYDMVSQSQNRRDRGSGRSFAKLIGNGYTTPDLADPSEASCFDDRIDGNGQEGHWHQGGNALKLILCTGAEAKRGDCHEDQEGRSVHFAVMHRKFSNDWDLPLRYERWFALWEGKAPFRLLARSRFPLLFANETAGGWTGEENWEDGGETMDQTARQPNSRPGRREGANLSELLQDVAQVRQASHNPHPPVLTTLVRGDVTTWLNVSSDSFPAQQIATSHNITQSSGQDYAGARKNWAYFTYTPSIAWSWRPTSAEIRREDRHGEAEDGAYLHSLNVGYLDDEVIVGIGLEDTAQAFAKVKARTLLQCLELCPGAKARAEEEGEGTTAE